MIRLFTALEIPPDIADRLCQLQSGLKGARWIDPENFHITLRFIGDVPENTAADIDEALQHITFEPFELTLDGVGQFGNMRPHAVWAGVSENEELRALQHRQEVAMQRLGLRPEPRKYSPHVTLARLNKRAASAADVMQYIEQHNLFASHEFTVDHFTLFSARTSRGGGPYVIEQCYPLAEESAVA
jgi:2'-5' RNA ligase